MIWYIFVIKEIFKVLWLIFYPELVCFFIRSTHSFIILIFACNYFFYWSCSLKFRSILFYNLFILSYSSYFSSFHFYCLFLLSCNSKLRVLNYLILFTIDCYIYCISARRQIFYLISLVFSAPSTNRPYFKLWYFYEDIYTIFALLLAGDDWCNFISSSWACRASFSISNFKLEF